MEKKTEKKKKILFGILSTAGIAVKVIKAIKDSGNSEVVAVGSRALETAQQFATQNKIPKAYGSYQELLDDPNIDAIYIPLPTKYKYEWAIKVALAKKHLLLEKPIPGTDDKQIKQIINICKQNQVQFMDGTMWLHSLRTKKIKNSIHKNEIGLINSVNASFTVIKYDPENIGTYPENEPMGVLGDLGWYPISAILFAFNYEKPISVNIYNKEKNQNGFLLSGAGYMKFRDNRFGNFSFSCMLPHRCFYEIVGSEGVIQVNDQVGGQGVNGNLDCYFNQFTGSTKYYITDKLGKQQEKTVEASDHTKLMVQTFSQEIQEEKVDYGWAKTSIACHQVLCAIQKSANHDKEIYL